MGKVSELTGTGGKYVHVISVRVCEQKINVRAANHKGLFNLAMVILEGSVPGLFNEWELRKLN